MRVALALITVGAVCVGVLAPAATPRAAAQGAVSLRIDPPSQAVNAGDTFTVKIIQTTPFETAGAQADFTFDPSLVQVVDVVPGPAYASAAFVVGVVPEGGAPQSVDEAIAEANASGSLRGIVTFLNVGSGFAPPGDNEFVTITLQASAPGSAPLSLAGDIQILDNNYDCYGCPTDFNPQASLGNVDVTGGTVDIGGTAPPPGTTPPPRAQVTPTVAAKETARVQILGSVTAVPSAVITSGTLALDPSTQSVAKDAEFTVKVTQKVDAPTTGVQVTLSFDKNALEVTAVEPSAVWKDATGATSQQTQKTVSDANTNGSVKTAFSLSPSAKPVAAGQNDVMTIIFKGRGKDAKSWMKFAQAVLLGSGQTQVDTTGEDGSVTIGSGGGGGGGSSMLLILGIVGGIVVVAGGGGAYYYRRTRKA